MGVLGCNLLKLQFCEARIKTIGMLREEGVERGLVADLQRKFIIAAIIGRRIGRGRNGCGRRRRGHKWNVIPTERTVDKRLLPVIGRLQHVVAHEAERPAHVEAGNRQVSCQRQRERASLPSPSAAVEPAFAE